MKSITIFLYLLFSVYIYGRSPVMSKQNNEAVTNYETSFYEFLEQNKKNAFHNPDSVLNTLNRLIDSTFYLHNGKTEEFYYRLSFAKILNKISYIELICKKDNEKASDTSKKLKEILDSLLAETDSIKQVNQIITEIGISNLVMCKVSENKGFYDEAIRYYFAAKKNFNKINNSTLFENICIYFNMGENSTFFQDSTAVETIQNFNKKLINEKAESQKKIILILIVGIILTIALSIIILIILKKNSDNKNRIKLRDSLLEGEEKERQRIGQELHDGVCSELSAIKMNLEILKNNDNCNGNFDKIINSINETNETIRLISHNLNSIMLVKFGFLAAVHNLCEKFYDIKLFQLKKEIAPEITLPLSESQTATIYRIIQELFNNIIKHSKATEVIFKMKQIENTLFILIKDNGIGFSSNTNENKNSLGLENIKTRVSLLNGTINILSKINKDTDIQIEIPFD